MKQRLILVAVLVYAVAWFLPVIKDGVTLSDGHLPGWQAFRMALSPVWPVDGDSGDGPVWKEALFVLSALTNFLFPITILVLRRAGRVGTPAWLRTSLVLAVVINFSWLLLIDQIGDLRIGYYLWVASFILLAWTLRGAGRARLSGSTA